MFSHTGQPGVTSRRGQPARGGRRGGRCCAPWGAGGQAGGRLPQATAESLPAASARIQALRCSSGLPWGPALGKHPAVGVGRRGRPQEAAVFRARNGWDPLRFGERGLSGAVPGSRQEAERRRTGRSYFGRIRSAWARWDAGRGTEAAGRRGLRIRGSGRRPLRFPRAEPSAAADGGTPRPGAEALPPAAAAA